jgi:hypothetical protein
MYSQISGIIKHVALDRSVYFGIFCSTPFSIRSKSKKKFNAAIMITNTLIPILIAEFPS